MGMCVHVCVCQCILVHLSLILSLCFVCACVCVCVCLHGYACACVCVCACLHGYVCACVCVCSWCILGRIAYSPSTWGQSVPDSPSLSPPSLSDLASCTSGQSLSRTHPLSGRHRQSAPDSPSLSIYLFIFVCQSAFVSLSFFLSASLSIPRSLSMPPSPSSPRWRRCTSQTRGKAARGTQGRLARGLQRCPSKPTCPHPQAGPQSESICVRAGGG